MPNATEKNRFLVYEFGLLSRSAALATRGHQCPIYADPLTYSDKARAKEGIQCVVDSIGPKYSGGHICESMHIEFIVQTAEHLSTCLGWCFHEGRFRIGVSQKLINLYLKYLWTAGLSPEPIHCPIDGRIRDFAGIDYDWTTNDRFEDYMDAIALLRKRTNNESLAVWELKNFRRANDE